MIPDLPVTDLANNELWLPVVGYERFFDVSNLGRVRRHARRVPVKQKYLGTAVSEDGCLTVILTNGRGRSAKSKVCLLVLSTFVGVRYYDDHRHLNGKHNKNSLDNLQWAEALYR